MICFSQHIILIIYPYFIMNILAIGAHWNDIELGCGIGGGVTICPGVEIGTEAIVAAGSTVTKDIPSRIVVAGNPAKKLKDVDANSYIKDSIRQQYEI